MNGCGVGFGVVHTKGCEVGVGVITGCVGAGVSLAVGCCVGIRVGGGLLVAGRMVSGGVASVVGLFVGGGVGYGVVSIRNGRLSTLNTRLRKLSLRSCLTFSSAAKQFSSIQPKGRAFPTTSMNLLTSIKPVSTNMSRSFM